MENCGFEIHSNKENSLFAALSFIVWGSEENSEQMKLMIVNSSTMANQWAFGSIHDLGNPCTICISPIID